MNFRQKIALELNNSSLSKEEVYHFKWRCAVRALPFLGYKGNLKFWRGKVKKQQYLYKIFQGLDLAYYYKNPNRRDCVTDIWTEEVEEELSNICFATDDLKIDNLINAINTAICSSKNDGIKYAANVYSLIDPNLDLNHPIMKENKLLPIILDDLQGSSKGLLPKIDINFYGEVWQLFEQVLLEMDCAYWWALYKSIFENNFAMDKEALRLRIQVSKKRIRKKGAAAVGHYLEELEKN